MMWGAFHAPADQRKDLVVYEQLLTVISFVSACNFFYVVSVVREMVQTLGISVFTVK